MSPCFRMIGRCLGLGLWAAVAALGAPPAAGNLPALTISWFPPAAYRGEPGTVVCRGRTGGEVVATLDGKEVARGTFTDPQLELSVALPGPGVLRLNRGDAHYSFRVVAPDNKVPLRERDGFLYDEEARPVILLVEHRFPPAVDRTWETVKVLKATMDDPRPVVSAFAFVGARGFPRSALTHLDQLTGTTAGFWTVVLAEQETFYEIDALLLNVAALRPSPGFCLGLSAQDPERGLNDGTFRMKLEWFLQALEPLQPRAVLVVSLPWDPLNYRQFRCFDEAMKIASTSHQALFVNGAFYRRHGPLAPADYFGTIMEHLRGNIRLP